MFEMRYLSPAKPPMTRQKKAEPLTGSTFFSSRVNVCDYLTRPRADLVSWSIALKAAMFAW